MSDKKESQEQREDLLAAIFGEEIPYVAPEQLAQDEKDSAMVQLMMYRDLPEFTKLAQNFINYFDLTLKVEDIDTKNCDVPTLDDIQDAQEFNALLPTDDVDLITNQESTELSVAEKRARYFETTQEINQANKPKFFH
jgi:hypothetical protein